MISSSKLESDTEITLAEMLEGLNMEESTEEDEISAAKEGSVGDVATVGGDSGGVSATGRTEVVS